MCLAESLFVGCLQQNNLMSDSGSIQSKLKLQSRPFCTISIKELLHFDQAASTTIVFKKEGHFFSQPLAQRFQRTY